MTYDEFIALRTAYTSKRLRLEKWDDDKYFIPDGFTWSSKDSKARKMKGVVITDEAVRRMTYALEKEWIVIGDHTSTWMMVDGKLILV